MSHLKKNEWYAIENKKGQFMKWGNGRSAIVTKSKKDTEILANEYIGDKVVKVKIVKVEK